MAKKAGSSAPKPDKQPIKKAPAVKDVPQIDDAAKTVATKGKFAVPLIIAAVIALLIIAGMFLLGGSSGGNALQQQFPSFQKVNSSVPQSFSSIQNYSGDGVAQKLAALSGSALSNVTQLSITYSGTLQASGSVVSINSPLAINDYIYGKEHRFEINVENIAVLGSADITYLNITNGTYTCTNFNSTALDNGNYEGVLLGGKSVSCVMSGALAGMDMAQLSNFNFSQLQNDGIQLSDSEIYQSTYMGVPCTFIAGTATVYGSASSGGLFQMCVSDVYYVPLSFSVYASGKGTTLALTLNETSIRNSSSQSAIEQVPGPVV